MPITIGSNISSLRAQRQLASGTSRLETVFERLSSGQRINKASDDAAGLAISEALSSDRRVFTQGVRNLNDGISILNITAGALQELTSIATRLSELAEQASNGVYADQQRAALDTEAGALTDEYNRIIESTTFNKRRLFDVGETLELRIQAGFGTNGSIAFALGDELKRTVGSTEFAAPISYSSRQFNADASIADLDGNGTLDLIISSRQGEGTFEVFLGNGDGSFTAGQTLFTGNTDITHVLGDFNEDGVVDVLSLKSIGGSRAYLSTGDGDGTFTNVGAFSLNGGPLNGSADVADVNGDGHLDLVAGNITDDEIQILYGDGTGSFSGAVTVDSASGGNDPADVLASDFNNDGILDLASANNNSGTVSIIFGTGGGSFQSAITFSVGYSLTGLEEADVDGDGDSDLITGGASGTSVLLNDGAGSFTVTQSFATGSNRIKAIDLDGDSDIDIVTAEQGSSELHVFLGDGSGDFSEKSGSIAMAGAYNVNAADFDGDAIPDLVVNLDSQNQIAVLTQLSVKTPTIARQSLLAIDDALDALSQFEGIRDSISRESGKIGAFQSRLSVAINVLSVSAEHFAAAAGRIKDADVAQETSQLTRLNILQQAASAVLAQANQQPALALRLLQ